MTIPESDKQAEQPAKTAKAPAPDSMRENIMRAIRIRLGTESSNNETPRWAHAVPKVS